MSVIDEAKAALAGAALQLWTPPTDPKAMVDAGVACRDALAALEQYTVVEGSVWTDSEEFADYSFVCEPGNRPALLMVKTP